jgi:hypothetical protein
MITTAAFRLLEEPERSGSSNGTDELGTIVEGVSNIGRRGYRLAALGAGIFVR